MNVKPLSGKDIYNIMKGNCKILPYENLKDYKDIYDIFDKSNFVFLLYPISNNFGHWVLLMKNNNIIEFFDSYGIFTDMEYKYGTKKTPKYLSSLLIKSNPKYKLYYNEIQFQEWGTNYCGYYCVVRALFNYLSLKKFQKMLKDKNNPSEYVYNYLLDS